VPRPGSNGEQHPPSRRNSLLARKTARYRALQRIGGRSVMPQDGVNGELRLTTIAAVMENSLVLYGDAVPKPLGFIALGQQWLSHKEVSPRLCLLQVGPRTVADEGARGTGCTRPTIARLSRRSGRIPAEPCPPLSCDQYCKGTEIRREIFSERRVSNVLTVSRLGCTAEC
jgi:hypothetical protein